MASYCFIIIAGCWYYCHILITGHILNSCHIPSRHINWRMIVTSIIRLRLADRTDTDRFTYVALSITTQQISQYWISDYCHCHYYWLLLLILILILLILLITLIDYFIIDTHWPHIAFAYFHIIEYWYIIDIFTYTLLMQATH